LELATNGFVSPYGRGEEILAHRVGTYALLALGREDRLLPSSVVNDELAARFEEDH